MPRLNWQEMISDGGKLESLMHAILYREDPGTILFGRPGPDSGQDARSADGSVVYQAKYRQALNMDSAVGLSLDELKKIKKYRQPQDANYRHWQNVRQWVLVANFSVNSNGEAKWQNSVIPAFQAEGLASEYWSIEELEGKLTKYDDIRAVFFEGENRVLGGLREAHDLLSADRIGSIAIDKPMIGRESEMQRVEAFAMDGDKRVLPVVGTGGIGKSRLLYEGLVCLAESQWRVFWALPGSMRGSSQWFRLLNGSQPTCIAIDDPDDRGLLRAVMEQLAMVERRGWKVILACRTDKSDVLRGVKMDKRVAEPVLLRPLDEPASKALMQAILDQRGKDAWLHKAYSYTKGIPGWLCLAADLYRQGLLQEWPQTADIIAERYVTSCIESLEPSQRQAGRVLLRWLALWGTLRLGSDDDEQELRFLEGEAIHARTTRDLLHRFVARGLVRNWGVDRRLYAVEPLTIREYVLGDWLFREEAGKYRVNDAGKAVVDRLAKGELPAVDRVLATLSHLTQARLDASEAFSFVKPVFESMATTAKDGTVLDQYQIVGLLEKAGDSDPESALEVMIAIRETPKPDLVVEAPHWGPQTFTHAVVVSKLPWTLFQIAEQVPDRVVARRYLAEFRALVAVDATSSDHPASGKGPQELLHRLLCESRNSRVFALPAAEIVEASISDMSSWPFVGLLLKSLLDPEREYTEFTAHWTITITKKLISLASVEWTVAARLRSRVIAELKTSPDSDLRLCLWQALAESHHQFHRMAGCAPEGMAPAYRTVLTTDLEACATILRSPPIPLTIEEATQARAVWSWYLEHGRDSDLAELARRCEQIYSGLSTWRFHEFFRFDTEEALSPETQRVAGVLRESTNVTTFHEFFTQAERYLGVARRSGGNAAEWRVSVLAKELADLFTPPDPNNALTSYVVSVLGQANAGSELAWHFAVCICRGYLGRAKATEGEAGGRKALQELLPLTQTKGKFLYDLYSNAHPATTGQLTSSEMACVMERESQFSAQEWFVLLGTFSLVDWRMAESYIHRRLEEMRDGPVEASGLMECFVRAMWSSGIRYKWPPERIPTSSIVAMIEKYDLNGTLLEMHELTWLRDQSTFKMTMPGFLALMQSRIRLDQRHVKDHSFQTIPHDFSVVDWCTFDSTDADHLKAFREFCRLGLGPTFTALFWIPRYVAQLDPSGRQAETFVQDHLRENPRIKVRALARLAYLASAYPDTSQEWARIALPICEKCQALRREERWEVYFGLSCKETGVLTSMPGEVSEHWTQALNEAVGKRDAESLDSPRRGYWEWAVECREADVQRERESAEEDAND